MDRSILEQPFNPSLIKTRRGAFGQTLSYVEGAEYIRRLNEAFAGEWSFEIVSHRVFDGEVLVIGKLMAGGIVKTAFGGSAVTTNRETGEPISMADDFKAAATDSLKKACSLFGIGLSLYTNGKEESNGSRTPVPSANPPARTNGANHNGTKPAQNGFANPGERISQRQLNALWSIGRKLNMSADDLRQRSTQLFEKIPENLNRLEASNLISELSDELGGSPF